MMSKFPSETLSSLSGIRNPNKEKENKISNTLFKMDIKQKLPIIDIEKTIKSDPTSLLYETEKIFFISLCKLSLRKNYLKSLNATKTIDLLGLLNNFCKEIQNIILPENSDKLDLVEDIIEENEINKKLNEIINSIKNLKQRFDELNKSKNMKDFGCNTDNKEEIKELKETQKNNFDNLLKENSELKKEINKLNKELRILLRNNNNNKNQNNNFRIPTKVNNIENNPFLVGSIYPGNPNNIYPLENKKNINQNNKNIVFPIIYNNKRSNNFN